MGRLQTARLGNFIRRWGSIKAGGSLLSESLGEVFPVLDLENLTPELLILAGIDLWSSHASATGGVAQLGGVQISNPVDSGAIVVVTEFFVSVGSTQAFTWGSLQDIFAGGPATSENRDTRTARSQGRAGIRISTNANTEFFGRAVALTDVDRIVAPPNGVAVLAPGRALTVVATTNNTAIRANFAGYLRSAEPSELNL